MQRAAERGQQHEAQCAETRQREDVRCRGQPCREQHTGEYGSVERERPLQPRRVVRGVRVVVRDEVAHEEAARQGADGVVAEGARQRGEDGREAEQPTDLLRARRRLRFPHRARLRVSEPKPEP